MAGSQTKESSGVIQMIDNLVNDVEKENQVMELEEEDAQGDYKKFMADAKDKRAADSKSMSDAECALAETDEQMMLPSDLLFQWFACNLWLACIHFFLCIMHPPQRAMRKVCL